MAGNSITGTFGLDLTPLRNDFAEAARIAKTEAPKVQQAINASAQQASNSLGRSANVNWADIARQNAAFNADPARAAAAERIRRNSAAGFAPAPRGKYPSPEEDEDGGGRGGVPRGVGRALTLLSGVGALATFVIKANEEAAKLKASIADVTKLSGSSAFVGTGSLEAKLKGIGDELEGIFKRDVQERQGTFGSFIKKARQYASGATDESDEAQRQELRKKAAQTLDDLGEKQTKLNAATAKGLFFSERQAELDKAEIAHNEKLGAIAEAETRAGANNPAARRAENERAQIESEQINRRFRDEALARGVEGAQGGIRDRALHGGSTTAAASLTSARLRVLVALKRFGEADIEDGERERRKNALQAADSDLFERRLEVTNQNRGADGAAYRQAERVRMRHEKELAAQDHDKATSRGRDRKSIYADLQEDSSNDASGILTEIRDLIRDKVSVQ